MVEKLLEMVTAHESVLPLLGAATVTLGVLLLVSIAVDVWQRRRRPRHPEAMHVDFVLDERTLSGPAVEGDNPLAEVVEAEALDRELDVLEKQIEALRQAWLVRQSAPNRKPAAALPLGPTNAVETDETRSLRRLAGKA